MMNDRFYMKRALALARKGLGRTSPNPVVGCVIVGKGGVIAEGWHQACGTDHAEAAALKKAGVKARGAVMYVTLEPCAHWGRTPPCVDAILSAGIRKVVVAMIDPDKRTCGKSVRKLVSAGVEVVTGICEEEAREINAPFIKYQTMKMPFVTAKTAQTLDGRIATRTGDSKWITSDEARAFSRNVRNGFDAILAGIDTVLADDPVLDAPAKRIIKVVVDSRLRISVKAKLFKGTDPGQVIVAVTKKAPLVKARRLESLGASVIFCPEKGGRVDLEWLFKELAKREITSILVEGGAAVIGSALKAGLVDEWQVYISPKVIGDDRARASVTGLDVLKVKDAFAFRIAKVGKIGPDVLLTMRRS